MPAGFAGRLLYLLPELLLSIGSLLLLVHRRDPAARREPARALGRGARRRARHRGCRRGLVPPSASRDVGARAGRASTASRSSSSCSSSSPSRVTVLMSRRYLAVEGVQPGEYYFLVLCATLGMMFMAAGIDLITIFIGLETMARLVLHPGGLHPSEPAVERGGGEVLRPRGVLARPSCSTGCR